MIIPDLDEEEAEDLTAQVAVAPKNLGEFELVMSWL